MYYIYNYFASDFLCLKDWTLIRTAVCRALLIHLLLYVDALQIFTSQEQQGQAEGSRKVMLRRRGVFTWVIIALTPSTCAGPFVTQTKEGTLQILLRFTKQLSERRGWLSPPHSHLATLRVTCFQLRRVH